MKLRKLNPQNAVIAGWSHGRFGKRKGSLEELVAEVVSQAVESAGLDPEDIDEAYFGNFNSGIQPFSSPSSLLIQAETKLWGIPITRVENACASGSAAVHLAARAVLARAADHVLVVGAEKMTDAPADIVGRGLIGADYDQAGQSSETGFAGLFAKVADAYTREYGSPDDANAIIATKNHLNGLSNPFAHLQKDFSYEYCSTISPKNPLVAGQLRRTDCSPISDGAAALIVSRASSRSEHATTPGVRILAMSHTNDYAASAKRDPLEFRGSAKAWKESMQSAGVQDRDLSFIELHDCFTIAELNLYEVLDLTPRGTGRGAAASGVFHRDGRLPVNVSGGLKSKGHPVGATGVSQHVITSMQLTGTAGDMQLPSPKLGAVHNMGGLAVANYVSVLGAAE